MNLCASFPLILIIAFLLTLYLYMKVLSVSKNWNPFSLHINIIEPSINSKRARSRKRSKSDFLAHLRRRLQGSL